MSKKTLNKANLERLGAAKLAELVMELVQGSAALQRRARMELSAAQGPKEVTADLRKRFASLRRSRSYVDWRKQRALVKDLNSLLAQVETVIAPQDADEAFELLWSFLQLASSIHERTDDSNGSVGDVFSEAVTLIGQVAPRVTINPQTLAERILDAVADAGYGEFDGIIPETAEALGPEGLEHLKRITKTWADTPPTPEELAAYERFGLSSSPADSVRRAKQSTCSIILADVADAQGDVDAYMARYSAEQLTYGTIAPDVARRLIDAGRVQEAYDILRRCMSREADTPLRIALGIGSHGSVLSGNYLLTWLTSAWKSTLDALEQALHDRRPVHKGGLIHHSDRGGQYLSIRYTERLALAGIEPSVGSVGDSYDNALAETINGLYKAEVIHRLGPWKTMASVEWETLKWVDWFNNRRLLEPIGYIPPAEAEERYYGPVAV